ncbi:polysaccharide pyruvyl transferase family protein [Mesorhizobium mediterraneum]|uniref:polysaccharide pyruvyl transferase family protein n=1 Tax=Mesorhizobium mediterraneum TaxID=43617 RepID=UPI00177F48D8|nr:polysaccharide pyruvyl transferase family protein [Mesorhizobium mediterraneum]
MLIGTLTLHTGYNEGAQLQSLALQRCISDLRPGSPAEIVDHRYPRRLETGYGPATNARQRTLAAFADGLLLSPKRFYSEDRSPTFRYVSDRYDAVVVGSDEVWKIDYVSRLGGLIKLQTNPLCPPFPNVYWPEVACSKIAYAASTGSSTKWTEMPRRNRYLMAKCLNDFVAIGVRDERTRELVLWADPSLADRVTLTPDPTVTHDLTSNATHESLRVKLASWGVDFNRPRALVIAGQHELYAEATTSLRARGVQIVSVSDRNHLADIDLTEKPIDPLEWANLASQFSYCLSERMHGALFALRNRCPLICLDSRRPAIGFPTKNEALMTLMGIPSQYVSIHRKGARDHLLDMCENLGKLVHDYMKIDNRFRELAEIGRTFLDRALPAAK